jgi:redox-sensitive bicupin YhaK (pirin superfamily)
MGPYDFEVGKSLGVPPRPRTNLATVTYLCEGEILHKDSIGSVQSENPGAINLMIAGSGIAHSERGPDALRQYSRSMHGLQLWHGLPEEHEEIAASFHQYPVEDLPATTINNVHIRLLIGEAFGLKSPVRTFTQTLSAEYHLSAGQSAAVPADVEELAVYSADSKPKVDDERLAPRRLALLTAGSHQIHVGNHTRAVFIGGQSLGRRYM